ncbi:putative cytochrome P450 [Cercophora scortea]|uniref:Cytochrome P450 n=1 Tax=Cercophora scortea TaxID=314031 RepID=A0AAE0IA34_9PEZI|nr:putative cytochrome P450 [Cercophora scortea]
MDIIASLVGVFRRHWIEVLTSSVIGYIVCNVIYNFYLHPLARFPGPFLARSTLLWRFWATLGGRDHRIFKKQHEKYGTVFRVSPNELSFSSLQSYKDIYGFPANGRKHFDVPIKSDFYAVFGSGFKTGCVGSERDPQEHARKRKSLLPAFSSQALAAQEDILQRCTDAFIDKISIVSQQDSMKGINIVEWLEMNSFDLLGEMAFGESFGCIAQEKEHFWIDLILRHLREIVLVDNLRRFSLIAAVGSWLLPSLAMRVRAKHTRFSREKVQRRLESDTGRQDFFTDIAEKVKSGEIPLEEMTAHASTLIIAGAETTATSLSAAMYYLLKTPTALKRLTTEIRARYKSYGEINIASAMQLPYLQAVINETTRVHPSGAHGHPRVSPGIQVDGKWVPQGTEIYTSTWSVSHSAKYFANPDEFRPERWIEPGCTDVKEASQPFLLGPRACIGKSFALVQMSLVLAKILYRYELELVDKNLDWEAESRHWIMWWKAPIQVRVYSRGAQGSV